MVASNGQVLATSFTWQDPSIALVAAEPYQSSSTASILRDDQATSARTWLR
jgi:hypothetical protein